MREYLDSHNCFKYLMWHVIKFGWYLVKRGLQVDRFLDRCGGLTEWGYPDRCGTSVQLFWTPVSTV